VVIRKPIDLPPAVARAFVKDMRTCGWRAPDAIEIGLRGRRLKRSPAGDYRSEDRYDPQHIEDLPPEVRAGVARQCDSPRALHPFANYSDNMQTVVLHRARRSAINSNRASPFRARDKDNVGVLLAAPRTPILQHDHSEI
jgi:hypothetical protein